MTERERPCSIGRSVERIEQRPPFVNRKRPELLRQFRFARGQLVQDAEPEDHRCRSLVRPLGGERERRFAVH
jgi:hypothetical protein